MKRLSTMALVCLMLAAVSLPLLGVEPAGASTAGQTLGCGIGGNQTMTITGSAPANVVQGTPFTVDMQPSQAVADGAALTNMSWHFQIPTGSTLVPGSITTVGSGIGSLGAVTTSSTSTVVSIQVAGPVPNGSTFQPPLLRFQLNPSAAVGTHLQMKVANPAYKLTAVGFNISCAPTGTLVTFTDSTVLALPGAPTIGTATGGNGEAGLTWTAPASTGGSPITGYVVTPYIGATPQPAQTFNSTATSQTIPGLTNGTAYTFKVAAKTVAGTGAQSAASNAVTPAAPIGVPGAPTIGTATGGNGQAGLTWTAPASDGGSPITGYVVTPYLGGSAQSPVDFNSTATSQTITGLTNGLEYTFSVAAKNIAGTGAQSAASNAVTPAAPATAPGAPTDVVASGAGSGAASVSWTAPATGGSPITGYVVTPFIGAAAQTPQTFESADTTQTVDGLTNGTAYTFKVAAVNAVGTGDQSASSNEVTPSTHPDAPTDVSAVAGDESAEVSWTAPTEDGGSPITGYVVFPYVGETLQTPQVFDSTDTTQTVTGLTNGTAYAFTVVAVNGSGGSDESVASDPVTPYADTAPGAPTIGSAFAGNAKATLSWTAPASNGGPPVSGYVVTPYIGATPQTPQTFASTATTQEITGLTNGTAYTFKVAAVNSVGTGAESAASNAVTPSSVTAPGAPTITNALPGNGQITVSWSAPSSNGGSAVTGYEVTPYIGGVAQAPVAHNATSTNKVITGLTNGTAYTFTVAAKNAVGTGAPSAPSSVVISGTPGVPGFQAAAPGDASAKVVWTAANGNGSPVTGYTITPYIGATPQTPQTFNSTATTQVVTGLTNGVDYTFKVAAINVHGTGAYATTNVARVGAPNGPGFPRAVPGVTTARVAWVASLANGAPIQGYRVTPYVGSTPGPTTTYNSTAVGQVLSGLTSGVTYTFKVEAFNSYGTGPVAQSAPWVQGTPEPPGFPTAVPGNGAGTVAYYLPPANGAPITSYTVWPVVGSTVGSPQVFNTPSATSLTVTGLTNGTTYTLRIAATNSLGTGPYNVTKAFVAGTPTAPGFPGAQPGNGTAKVAWSAANANGSPVTSHVITPYIGSVAQTPQTFLGSATNATVTGLTNGTIYTFRVKAVNAVGTGLEAATALTTKVGTPTTPVFPSGAPLDSSAKVSWGIPTANASPIIGYVITPMVGSTALPSKTFASTANNQVFTGLTNGTTYTFRVAAINALGTGPYAVTGAVKVGLPSAPTAVAATTGVGQASVQWTAPAANGSPITGYIVTPFIGATAQSPRSFAGNTATGQVITGLTAGTAYTFKVQAINAIGTGAQSTASNAVTPT